MPAREQTVHERRIAEPMQWTEICKALYLVGYMTDFTRSECLREAKRLQERVRQGATAKLERGRYAIPPELIEMLSAQEPMEEPDAA
jgi:hypothetical protein